SKIVTVTYKALRAATGTVSLTNPPPPSPDPAPSPPQPVASVRLTGALRPPAPKIQLSTTSLSFTVSPQTLSVSVRNIGDAGTTLTGTVTVAGAGYTIDAASRSFSLARNASQSLNVKFTKPPTGTSPFLGTLTITSNDPLRKTATDSLKAVVK